MSSKYWIKLYHEVLYDRKVASLDDHLWRRVIECFLLAGEQNENGFLPEIDDMSWTLRTNKEELETDLNTLISIGILEFKDGYYFVRQFAARQAPLEKSEYMRRLRGERQREEYETEVLQPSYQSVTISNAESESDTDKETYIDKKPDHAAKAAKENSMPLSEGIKFFLQSFNATRFKNNIQRDTMLALEKKYGTVKLKEFTLWAARNGFTVSKAVASAEKALENWGKAKIKDGKKDDPGRYVSGKFAEYIEH